MENSKNDYQSVSVQLPLINFMNFTVCYMHHLITPGSTR